MKKILKTILFKLGYKIKKINNNKLLNPNPFLAVKHEIKRKRPVVFDIGMNHGQTLKKIKKAMPNSIIHGFEASKYCFKQLNENFGNSKNITLNNLAVGSENGILKFNEYSWDAMNSFLKRAYGNSKIIDTYNVKVITIDTYCLKNNIKQIDVLKSDTEGFELKVLKGAEKMMCNNKIQFIHIELFFDLNFIGQSSVGEIFNFLEKNKFLLVNFSDFSRTEKGYASKSDALFINTEFNK
ncbi:MAG: FkbM family methyltransferase [Flavobacteriaceae bacterium]|nr:FkbM family methyltransferase [Flavobacteriaceae bacterium]